MGELYFHLGEIPDLPARYARARLLAEVLGVDTSLGVSDTNPWLPSPDFDDSDLCAANIDVAILPLTIAGENVPVAGIRSVAVAPDRRGQGLFRKLMQKALGWCDKADARLVLLYTEEPDLYRRFGFEPLVQHAFVGAAPARRDRIESRRVDLDKAEHHALVRKLVETRTPVSSRCALGIDPNQFLANLRGNEDYGLVYVPALDALLVSEQEDDTFVVVDVVASDMPDAGRLLGAIDLQPKCLKILFPPDRLDWHGTPVCEDTGLMARGPLPAPMTRPFMLPPTVEF